MNMTFSPDLTAALTIPAHDSWPETKHHFDAESVWAVRAAIAARRPLLLRGEPGIGKSQMARAVAAELKVPFLYHVVDERSERDDLLLSFDAISRLAEAQVSALTAAGEPKWRDNLAELNFIRPGVLWWAFNWKTAKEQADIFSKTCRKCDEPSCPDGWTPEAERMCGPVVLVDEIDKADPSVPNGLLESLGNQGFKTNQLVQPVCLAEGTKPPLVIITTNEERELPAAFLRRCLVLQMRFPKDPDDAENFLIRARARIHWTADQVSDTVCKRVVGALLADREAAARQGLAIPGAAEFLDILRALVELHPSHETEQLTALEQIKNFALKKNVDEAE